MLLAVWLVTAATAATVEAQPAPMVATIQVQGNVLTSEEEVIRLSGVTVGDAFDDGTIAAVAARLKAAGRFQSVDVLKRFASIADLSQIALVIIVDDGPMKIERSGGKEGTAQLVRSRGWRLLFLPVLRFDEGYGLTYGVRLAKPTPIGPRSQLSMPLTWGGERRAGAQLEQRFEGRFMRRIEIGGAVSRTTHPYLDVTDTRAGPWITGNLRAFGPIRPDVSAGWDHVTFGGEDDAVGRVGAGVTVDNRLDPMLARKAVYARAAWAYLDTRHGGGLNTIQLDLRGYVGLIRQAVLVARVTLDTASGPRPPYLKPMLGGTDSLRGFAAGSAIGDSLASGSLEVRVPVTSPLSFVKFGVNLFVDAATVYDDGERLRDQHFERGVGGGVWMSAAFLRLTLSVARGIGHGTRVNASTSLGF